MILLALGMAAVQGSAPAQLLDAFERIGPWSAHPAQGVGTTLRRDTGRHGHALRMDFDYHGGGGYAIARRAIALDLPENYEFSFWLKGMSPPNTLEFKVADSTGDNVWWHTERDRVFDGQWHLVTIRKRQIAYAWGPLGGGEIVHPRSLEIVITAGNGGGKGSVWIDDLKLMPLPVILPYDGTPTARASAAQPGFGPGRTLDGDTLTAWRPSAEAAQPALTIDFGREREFGGLSLQWETGRRALHYSTAASSDGIHWKALTTVEGQGRHDHLYLPDSEGRYLRIALTRPEGHRGFGLSDVQILPLSAGSSRNDFFQSIAAAEPAGRFPRYWSGSRPFWTVVGVDQAREEALISEDAAIEPGTGAFSVEPFVMENGRLSGWHEGVTTVGLTDSTLPIPWITRDHDGLRLTLLAFATGAPERSSLVARYRITNLGNSARRPTLYLAVRPFQVNPPTQFLNHPGGFTPIDSIRWTGTALRINGDRSIAPFWAPTWVGATPFRDGEIVTRLAEGRTPSATSAIDLGGTASAALGWSLSLRPGDSADVAIEIPFRPTRQATIAPDALSKVDQLLAAAREQWRSSLTRSGISLPASGAGLSQSITSTLGYILVNRDGPAIQPGSRSYERSWIRDGALTSTALLRFGHPAEVKEFIEWYAGYLGPDGRVPCCVDTRGADPVPEHDSHGEFIYLVMEYFRHTGDRAFLLSQWPRVAKVAGYIDSLRHVERTDQMARGADTFSYGLLPPSISHEGYSAKAQHSYWDDFFALRGLKDATSMAGILGDTADALRFGRDAEEFQADLLHSINRTIAAHGIDFIPGSADLGDFDATSTTIALSPGGAESWLPPKPLRQTFDDYWENTRHRRVPGSSWDAYTPYELRTIGALLRLGEISRAWTLLDEFLADQEPPAWHQWPEVVHHDPHALKFIGDLPHTWVGSDFLRSAADLFAWERESDSTLVLGQGIKPEWLEGDGVRVRNLSTWWGLLNYTAHRTAQAVVLDIEDGVRIPAGGITIALPAIAGRHVTSNGTALVPDSAGWVRIAKLPAHLTIQ